MTPEQVAEAQKLAREFKPHMELGSNNSVSTENPTASGTGFFITDDGYLISNYHVVKDATKVRLLTGAGLIDAKVVQVDAAIVSAKLDASVALAASGALPENVNYAVKSSFLLSFLESVPDVSAKLKAPISADRKFEDVVKSAQDAAVLVLVY